MLDYCYLANPYFNRFNIIQKMQDFLLSLVSKCHSNMGGNLKNGLHLITTKSGTSRYNFRTQDE